MKLKRHMGATLVAILIVSIVCLLMVGAAMAAGVSEVTRSVTSTGSGQSQVIISINSTLPLVFAVNETLPAGCTFVSSTLPQGQYEVSGSNVYFVAVNTTTFNYVVQGLGNNQISGHWTDMLGTGQGIVNGNATTGQAGGNTGSTPTPGFLAIATMISICLVAFFAMRRDDN